MKPVDFGKNIGGYTWWSYSQDQLEALVVDRELPVPKKRIVVSKPEKDENQLFVGIFASDDEAKELVNKHSKAPWVTGKCGDPIIPNDRYDGYFILNPCYDMEEVVSFLESLI